MPVRMTKKGRAETREDKRSEQANQQAMSAQAASSPSEGKGSKKAKEPKSPTERKNEKKAQIREARMTSTAKRYGERYTPGMLSGGQVKLDKNKDGKISGEDFKMMKRKRGGSTPGLKDYVKKSDSEEKKIKAVDKKTGKEVFVSRKQILTSMDSYRPVESGIKNFVSEYARQKSQERKERLSESDKERAEKMMKRKRGGATRKNPNSPKGQNPISEYDKKGKLKYTAANQGGMMAKSTRGYGAARTSGMGLQDEQVKPGKVQKAFLGIMAMKKAKKKGAKGAEFLSPALLAKRILGKKTGGPISGPKGGLPRMSDIDKDKIGKLKQQLNRFRNTPTKGGGADESKRMSDKTKQSIKNLVKRIGRLTPAAKIGSDAGKIIRERLKKKIMTPAKKMGGGMINRFNKGSIARVPGGYSKEGSGRISDKALKGNSPQKLFSEKEKMGNKKTSGMRKKMGGGMMMKQYNKGGSVTASCKLGRNKATKLY